MAYNELLQSMELSAQEKIQSILESARRSAESVITDAQREAEAIKKRLLAEAESSVRIERNRSMYLLSEELKADLTVEKGRIYREAFSEAEKRLGSCRMDPRYQASFSHLLDESLEGIPASEAEVHIDPKDAPLCSTLSGKTGTRLVVVPDLTCLGGIVVRSGDNSITITNTLETRFENAKEALKKEIYSLLFR
jgi:vacuolar-type H+-ATPase subunit E/Vma4